MYEDKAGKKDRGVKSDVEETNLESGPTKRDLGKLRMDELKEELASYNTLSPQNTSMNSVPQSRSEQEQVPQSPSTMIAKQEEIIGGEVTVKQEPGQPPKLSRSTSRRITSRAPLLFEHYPDKTQEAKCTFEFISECSYTSKYIGSTEHDSMDCDCAEEWDSYAKSNSACGPNSDCINRATKMECVGDCGCGADCQNQRFQKRRYANVTVIQTEKKGYGLRSNTDLSPDEMIYEYIGEVIDEARFRRRMVQYDEEGIKHFYFMSLSKGEFVDATKKGNLGRFCNHSCNPNCYVDKWVVGDKLRMGIFAERKIQKGEELVFNYNVDRYGANPQPCYCGEPNCTGFIGGKTQTERGTKLSNTTIEALGIDDGDGWDTAVPKKPRKKKVGEEDEEYVNNVQPKSLDENGVTKVMATLMQCKEKWIAVKLLGRIQRCDDERVRNRVVKMHGYQILNSTLALWKEDANVILQIFDILDKFPRLTRNKISDSKIESTVESLLDFGDERVEIQAANLLKEWSALEVAYRIPRKNRETLAISAAPTLEKSNRFGRRDNREDRKGRSRSRSRSKSRSRSIDAPRGPAAPSGPRSSFPQRNPDFYGGPRPPFRPRPFHGLPSGWFPATDENGRTYYYDANGKTTWQRPTVPAVPPPPPPKPASTNKALEDIINEITSAKANDPKDKQASTPARPVTNGSLNKDGKEKWRTYTEEKQKKLYENTLFPHIKHVMDKYKGKLPKDDLKRFAKEISKKLVSSDYKNHRVDNPTMISSRQEKQVKKYVQEYFEKAVAKKKTHDKQKAECKAKEEAVASQTTPPALELRADDHNRNRYDKMATSDDENDAPNVDSASPTTPLDHSLISEGLKRKREPIGDLDMSDQEGEDATPNKRMKSESPPIQPPPPPAAEPSSTSVDQLEEDETSWGPKQDLTADTDSFANDESVDDDNRPPPPPPPLESPGPRTETSGQTFAANTDFDITEDGQNANLIDSPQMEIADDEDERVPEVGQHFPGRGRRVLPEVQV
ncbi:histone methyltransferase set2 [Lecanora helva]